MLPFDDCFDELEEHERNELDRDDERLEHELQDDSALDDLFEQDEPEQWDGLSPADFIDDIFDHGDYYDPLDY